jgi:Flp pilus assembly protein TadG
VSLFEKKQWARGIGRAKEDGQAVVEMALALPLLLLVVTGIMAFGVTLNHYIELTDGVSIAGRQVAIHRGNTTDPCADAVAAVTKAAPNLTPAQLSYTLVLNGNSYSGTSCSSESTTTGAAGDLVQGADATLTVTYPCSLGVFGWAAPRSCTLASQVTELVQ